MIKRGIIISPFHASGRQINLYSPDIKKYLLYWDKIDWPCNNYVFHDDSESQILIDEGLMERTLIRVDGTWDAAHLFVAMQRSAFELHHFKEPGVWSLGLDQDLRTMPIPKGLIPEEQIIEIELYNCLPSPAMNVPYDDILNFKEKRKAELFALRHSLDSLYLGILTSKDIPRAKIRAIDDIEKAIQDVNKAMTESMAKRILDSLKIQISSSLFPAAVSGYVAGEKIGYPIVGTILGAASSMIRFDLGKTPSIAGHDLKIRDFAYIYYARDEGII